MPRSAGENSSSQRILDVAEELAQRRGFNGFSYADIASALLVTKASLHYHFPSKADLGAQLIARYRAVFNNALLDIGGRSTGEADKLRRYARLYEDVLVADRMCLCGMFAAEYSTLPRTMQTELRMFFDDNEAWLTAVLEDGRRSGQLTVRGTPAEHARILVDVLEGAMLVARTYGDVKRFRAAARYALAELGVEGGGRTKAPRRLPRGLH